MTEVQKKRVRLWKCIEKKEANNRIVVKNQHKRKSLYKNNNALVSCKVFLVYTERVRSFLFQYK